MTRKEKKPAAQDTVSAVGGKTHDESCYSHTQALGAKRSLQAARLETDTEIVDRSLEDAVASLASHTIAA